MMREWVTVVSWQQGIATVVCETRSGCGGCSKQSACGSAVLDKLGAQPVHQFDIESLSPLVPGQKVEIGLAENSLLQAALLVYLLPVIGLIAGAAILQILFDQDLAAIAGAFAGGWAGFLLAKRGAAQLNQQHAYQPKVLQIGLPPSILRQP